MDKEIQKKISRNWFKILQDIFCNEIEDLENNKINVGNILLIPYKKDPMQREELCKEDNCDEYNYS